MKDWLLNTRTYFKSMGIRSPLKLLLALFLYTTGICSYADVAIVSPATIIGEWHATENHPEKGNIDTRFVINADKTFSGSLIINNVPVWLYSGTWTLEGNRVTWVYLESNIVLLQEDIADTDEILSVTDETLTYRSLRRGKESTLQRMK